MNKKNKIVLKRKKYGTDYLLLVGFHSEGKPYFKSTGLKVPMECWVDGKVVNKKGFVQAEAYNNELERAKERLTSIRDIHFGNFGKINPNRLDSDWNEFRKGNESSNSLLYNYRNELDQFIVEGRKKRSLATYEQTYKRLRKFEASRNTQTMMNDLDPNWLKAFNGFLVKENYSNNTIHKTFKDLKCILRSLKNNGLNISDNILNYKSPQKPNSTPKVVITPDEFYAILNTPLPYELENHRILFLIGLSTGLRFSDLIRLSISNLSKESIDGVEHQLLTIISQKTGVKIQHDITNDDVLLSLVKKLFKPVRYLSEQNYNRGIKQVCKIAKLDSRFHTYKIQGGEKDHISKPKWQFVTSHTARYSYITNLFKRGVDPFSIKDLTGISSDSTLRTYLHLTNRDQIIRFKNGSIPNNPYTYNNSLLALSKTS